MSYAKDVKEFREQMAREGVPPKIVAKLLRLANRHEVLAEIACGVDVGDKFEQEDKELDAAILKLAPCPGIKSIRLDGDPRGYTVKLMLTSGAHNTWGGKECGWGVPTRPHSWETVETLARMPARHWD
jgi:hypothetical protein